MSYRDLEVWNLARKASISVHRMTVQELPKFETYEEGSQIRRSVKSIRANIVEGYGGTVSFESQVGAGTTFYITLPVEKEKEHDL